jgi:hypothetical protein
MTDAAFRPIFDGETLEGWHITPRLPVPRAPGFPEVDTTTEQYQRAKAHLGRWTVEEGAIVGRQDPPGSGLGAYIVSDGTFADFELSFEARPDWPADTGILVRATDEGTRGFQILLDHRKSGSIGGFYGNGIGGFHAITYNVDAVYGPDGQPVGLRIEDPATTIEPITPDKPALLEYGATGEEFLKAWKWDEWNAFHIRVEGESPRITVAINGTPVSRINTATMRHPHYDAAAIRALLGRRGHIAFEVHDNDPKMGEARWGRNAACRWRNVQVREL